MEIGACWVQEEDWVWECGEYNLLIGDESVCALCFFFLAM